ncbi:Cellobiose dehydrogenase [Rhizoctonia solani]|uniref:Cellobiose dehydrogenase n=1 Tax=Rhizoctonia solani TaxID=456999 RepID=A0A8H7ILK0_9AGAM|nr:Cellobiose dehydrogenase [Rhizoctonia solani]
MLCLFLFSVFAGATLAQGSVNNSTATTRYDYIVVGAGASGIIVADRLSEAGKNVLLIERGGPSTLATGGTEVPPWPSKTNLTRFDIPGLYESIVSTAPAYWWCDDIQAGAACLIGGGTAVNGLLYWYPTDAEWDTSNGWPKGWQQPNAALNKVKARLPSTDIPSTDGKRYLTQVYDVVKSILKTQNYSAITINEDRNSKNRIYGHPNYYIQDGKRTGPMDTYLKTARARSNFKLITNTKVLSVIRNGAQITGVQTNDNSLNGNGIIQLTSKGRVILSAGAFGTAKILFGSGIGPSDQIALIAGNSALSKRLPPSSQYINLPVGMNVKDKPGVNLIFTHPSVDWYDNFAPIWSNPVFRTQTSMCEIAQVFLPVRLLGSTFGVNTTGRTARPVMYRGHHAQFVITLYLATGLTSTGRIGMKDTSLAMSPIVKPWFTDPVDKAVMINAMSDILSTYKQVPDLVLVAPDNVTSIDRHIAQVLHTPNHWTGSTRIGTSSSDSVVDTTTKVWGTDNLFVVDAGIMPGMTAGNPQGAIFVMAENAVAKIIALAGGP